MTFYCCFIVFLIVVCVLGISSSGEVRGFHSPLMYGSFVECHAGRELHDSECVHREAVAMRTVLIIGNECNVIHN